LTSVKNIRDINESFTKLLGIQDELITKITIELTPNDLPMVTIEKILDLKDPNELKRFEYELRIKE